MSQRKKDSMISPRATRTLKRVMHGLNNSSMMSGLETGADSEVRSAFSSQILRHEDILAHNESAVMNSSMPIMCCSKSAARNLTDIYSRLDTDMKSFFQQQRILYSPRQQIEASRNRITSARQPKPARSRPPGNRFEVQMSSQPQVA